MAVQAVMLVMMVLRDTEAGPQQTIAVRYRKPQKTEAHLVNTCKTCFLTGVHKTGTLTY